MAKRDDGTKRVNAGTTTKAPGATTTDAMEERVVAFAEQLGRIAGTIRTKTEGWMDRERLHKQIASVRDGAAHLLEQLADATKAPRDNPAAAAARRGNKGRSGGVVDAPGKRHRKRTPTDPDANTADSQAAKMRTARTMEKTNRLRERGYELYSTTTGLGSNRFSQASSSRRVTAERPRSPYSNVSSLTYIPTNRSALARSRPRPNCSA